MKHGAVEPKLKPLFLTAGYNYFRNHLKDKTRSTKPTGVIAGPFPDELPSAIEAIESSKKRNIVKTLRNYYKSISPSDQFQKY